MKYLLWVYRHPCFRKYTISIIKNDSVRQRSVTFIFGEIRSTFAGWLECLLYGIGRVSGIFDEIYDIFIKSLNILLKIIDFYSLDIVMKYLFWSQEHPHTRKYTSRAIKNSGVRLRSVTFIFGEIWTTFSGSLECLLQYMTVLNNRYLYVTVFSCVPTQILWA